MSSCQQTKRESERAKRRYGLARHVRRYQLRSRDLINLLNYRGVPAEGGFEVRIPLVEGVPDDALFFHAYYDNVTASFWLVFGHESFAFVDDGQEIPEAPDRTGCKVEIQAVFVKNEDLKKGK